VAEKKSRLQPQGEAVTGINLVAVGVAVLAAFVMSTAWYMVFAKQRRKLSGAAAADMKKPQPVKMVGELIRSFLLAYALAYLLVHTGVAGLTGAVRLGLVLWLGFPFVLLTGSIKWEDVPWKLAAIHAGDWLLKMLLMTVILSLWR
jgi:hypothetical protein